MRTWREDIKRIQNNFFSGPFQVFWFFLLLILLGLNIHYPGLLGVYRTTKKWDITSIIFTFILTIIYFFYLFFKDKGSFNKEYVRGGEAGKIVLLIVSALFFLVIALISAIEPDLIPELNSYTMVGALLEATLIYAWIDDRVLCILERESGEGTDSARINHIKKFKFSLKLVNLPVFLGLMVLLIIIVFSYNFTDDIASVSFIEGSSAMLIVFGNFLIGYNLKKEKKV